MSFAMIWAILGGIFFAVELLTGSFYLLVMGVSAAGAALFAWGGAPLWVQLAVFSVVSLAGFAILRTRYRPLAAELPSDIGARVIVADVSDTGFRVRHRGCEWDGQLESGEVPAKGDLLVISSVSSNTLICTRS